MTVVWRVRDTASTPLFCWLGITRGDRSDVPPFWRLGATVEARHHLSFNRYAQQQGVVLVCCPSCHPAVVLVWIFYILDFLVSSISC